MEPKWKKYLLFILRIAIEFIEENFKKTKTTENESRK
jgi:hypothetical protein